MSVFTQKILNLVCRNTSALCLQYRGVHLSSQLCLFWEKDDKGGYKPTQPLHSFRERMREGISQLKGEIQLWKEEMREHIDADPIFTFRPGEVDVKWKFDHPDSLKKWIATSDKDHGEGFSTCKLELTNYGKAHFHGFISNRVPKDGKIRRAGYCNIRSQRARKSFKREAHLDWTMYNMLIMKVRGDGRSYMLNINTRGYYDVTWNDMYHYVLYTRGGPYWQYVKIPFSKFFMASKGRIQDRQCSIPLDKVTSFGITAAERYNGAFSLEIDYIGLEFDPSHTEDFAYEMYKVSKYIVQT